MNRDEKRIATIHRGIERLPPITTRPKCEGEKLADHLIRTGHLHPDDREKTARLIEFSRLFCQP